MCTSTAMGAEGEVALAESIAAAADADRGTLDHAVENETQMAYLKVSQGSMHGILNIDISNLMGLRNLVN